MNFSDYPIDKDLQMSKIIEDTEEIIKNFRQISAVIVKNINNLNDDERLMFNLGKRLINYREEAENPGNNLGSCQINII